MKRIKKDNINTTSYWDEVYITNPFLASDLLRYSYLVSQLEDKLCTIVDLGCGTGQGCSEIKKRRMLAQVTGVDFSNLGIERAKEMNPYIDFRCANVTDTKLDSFDYVVSSETLEHLEEPQKLIDEIFRLTKEMAILTTPLEDRVPSGEHIWEFTLLDVEKMFKQAGFSKVFVYPWASQRMMLTNGVVKYPTGNLDTIVAIGIRT